MIDEVLMCLVLVGMASTFESTLCSVFFLAYSFIGIRLTAIYFHVRHE